MVRLAYFEVFILTLTRYPCIHISIRLSKILYYICLIRRLVVFCNINKKKISQNTKSVVLYLDSFYNKSRTAADFFLLGAIISCLPAEVWPEMENIAQFFMQILRIQYFSSRLHRKDKFQVNQKNTIILVEIFRNVIVKLVIKKNFISFVTETKYCRQS